MWLADAASKNFPGHDERFSLKRFSQTVIEQLDRFGNTTLAQHFHPFTHSVFVRSCALSAIVDESDSAQVKLDYMGMSGISALASYTAVTVIVPALTLPSTFTCLPAKGAIVSGFPDSV